MKNNSTIGASREVADIVTVTTTIGRNLGSTVRIHLTPEAALNLASQLIGAAGHDQWLEYQPGNSLNY